MIKINPANIGPDGETLSGSEDPAVLDLASYPEHVEAAGKIKYDLFASMAGKDLLVTGKVSVKIKAECAVCLDEVKTVLEKKRLCIHVENVPAEGEYDLTPEIRENLLLAMPMRFKCSENCKGICTGCGANLNHEKCSCAKKKTKKKEAGTPREKTDWSALDSLKL